MKVSRTWLQQYFNKELPSTEVLAEALTFHTAEIEEATEDMLDVNVLPDRAAYLLSHRGIATEISATLSIPLKRDPLREELPQYESTPKLSVSLDAEGTCDRYVGALITGVRVGPSPEWLRAALESVGQRSINNIVDATNYVMFNIGQPLHAFDADKLTAREGVYAIGVRAAEARECITVLSGETYDVPEGALLIADMNAEGTALGIAGIKGGKHASVSEETTNIILESAHFDGTAVRKTAQALKLFTDASSRFQNKPSVVLAAYGMRDVIALIQDIAGGTLEGVTDVHSPLLPPDPLSVTLDHINGVLGTSYSTQDVADAFSRLSFSYTLAEQTFTILRPFERKDLTIAEDLIEEAGRILGYDRIEPVALPLQILPPEQSRFRGIEAIKDFLTERGFTEISTPAFSAEGDIELENPLQEDRPFMRTSLLPSLESALQRAVHVAPRVLGHSRYIKLFEVGSVFSKEGESLLLSMGVVDTAGKLGADALKENVATLEQELLRIPASARFSLNGTMMELNLEKLNLEKLGETYAPISVRLSSYRPYSAYPFALRDVAVWTPGGTAETEVAECIQANAGELLVRTDLFDRFEKEGRISYAFRLVFESPERTLSDADLDPAMSQVTEALNKKEGWEVR
ncbi:phenylalanine--tRNA ligase subunit beta [Patescibacteria group bacterium]|nr:phenylalanine--tRNA ligase subunit beta [Patescibacteria group bacterium]MBU2124138.1 phenylalanine--tRNA ligase subunit beta [Patescibacteria group bacterium]MBU2194994.1 phenylalanine--tRNA ligase subunit beta [Patescibacteria group bacterium]